MNDWTDILDDGGDGERSHSRFAPSALKRILNCPRSVALAEAILAASGMKGVRRSSVYAAEGSVAHVVAEDYLRSGPSCSTALGLGAKVQQDQHLITIDQDMHEHGQDYADYVRGLMSSTSVLFVERTVNLDAVVGPEANMYGHLDAAVWSPDTAILDVIDYKYGRGIKVSPLANPQLMAYGLGALTSLAEIDPDEVRTVKTHVFQPRVSGLAVPDTIPTIDLLMWGADEVAPIVAEIMADGAINREYVTGEHCRFCPALAHCPAMRDRATQAAQKAFGSSPVLPVAMSADELAAVMVEVEVVGPFLDAVAKEALLRVASGQTVPGYKLVAKRGRRVWAASPSDVETVTGLLPDDLFEPAQIKSVAQVEKLLPKKDRAALKPLIELKSSGYSLASASDPRPAVSGNNAANVFAEVKEDE
jgi:hypothetical protein